MKKLTSLIEDFKVKLTSYRQVQGDYLNQIRVQDLDQALVEFENMNKSAADVENSINQISEINKKIASDIKTKNDNDYKRTQNIMIAVIAAGSLIALLLAFIISGIISKALNQIVDFAKKFGEGDLTDQLSIHTKDEIGVLA